MRNVLKGRKLLVASLGVAAVSYACHDKPQMTGNLMAPEPPSDAGVSALPRPVDRPEITGNLMPPPPPPDGDDDAGPKPKKAAKP